MCLATKLHLDFTAGSRRGAEASRLHVLACSRLSISGSGEFAAWVARRQPVLRGPGEGRKKGMKQGDRWKVAESGFCSAKAMTDGSDAAAGSFFTSLGAERIGSLAVQKAIFLGIIEDL